MGRLRMQVNRGEPRNFCGNSLVAGPSRRYVAPAPMSEPSELTHLLERAWRFAHVLTGCAEGAAAAFDGAVDDVRRHPHGDDDERLARLFLTNLRRRCLKFPARNELGGRPAALHGLPEPGRSALTLLCLNLLPAREIERVLDVDARTLGEALERGRAALASRTT